MPSSPIWLQHPPVKGLHGPSHPACAGATQKDARYATRASIWARIMNCVAGVRGVGVRRGKYPCLIGRAPLLTLRAWSMRHGRRGRTKRRLLLGTGHSEHGSLVQPVSLLRLDESQSLLGIPSTGYLYGRLGGSASGVRQRMRTSQGLAGSLHGRLYRGRRAWAVEGQRPAPPPLQHQLGSG